MRNRRFTLTPIKKILAEKGISQSQLAADLGVSYIYLNRIVNEWIEPSPELREKLAKYLNVQQSHIFNNSK